MNNASEEQQGRVYTCCIVYWCFTGSNHISSSCNLQNPSLDQEITYVLKTSSCFLVKFTIQVL
jgi:hypothetical protein